ncbi:MAG: hypothetical protein ACREYC_12600, partial [Gammaproteobacteria bacterium]
VRLLQPIRKKKTPDISYRTGGEVLYCEVKTVGVSNEEIGRLNSGEAFSGHLYLRLSEGFLGKLSSAIGVGLEQIKSASGSGLVYVVIQFDDFVLQHYSMYRQQIVELLQSKYPCHEICIRVGVCADHFIWHGPRQASRGRA